VDPVPHQWPARVASALGGASRWCAASSLLITLAAFVIGAATDTQSAAAAVLPGLIVVLGAVQIGLAVRIEFDRRIFDLLAAAPEGWSGFDDAMRELGLMDRAKIGRPPAARAAGLARLVRWHGGLLLAQLLLCLALLAIE
jgi:hypothetical protein